MAKPSKCVRCGRENDPSFAFCLDCGQPLRAPAPPPARETSGLCPKCAAALQPGFRFCGICGAPVGPPPAPRGRPGSAVSQTTPGAASGAASAPPAQAAPPVQRRLTLIRADGAPGATFPLEEDELLCGRTEGEVRLPDDPSVSPRHARFTRSGGDLRVEDLGSVNGIFLRLRAPRRLRVGEEIRLGSQLLRLEPLARPPAPPEGAVRSWGTPDGGCKLRLSQLLEGGGLGEIFPLREGENVVGRDAGEVTFPGDRYVSARHARLDVAGDEVTLADAGSSNGTFVKLDGAAELSAGDQLLVGAQLLRVD